MNHSQPLNQQFEQNGYVLVRGLFSDEEVAHYREHYMTLREGGSYPGDYEGVDATDEDPWKKYPRMIHMHRWDDITLNWLLDARIRQCMVEMLGEEPYAAQSMLYYKAPGARGQALHQDQYYLRVKPGTCIAAWLALDVSNEESGCLKVVEGSHELPILCVVEADKTQSFTDIAAPVPDDVEPISIIMNPGDVLFFHGNLIHGSNPNTSKNFRRALIGHYVQAGAEEVTKGDHPVLRFDGTEVEMPPSPTGGPCGVWVDEDTQQRRVEMSVGPRDIAREIMIEERNEALATEAAKIRARLAEC